MSSFKWPPPEGVVSINGDTSSSQEIVGGTGISVATSGGTTTITNTGGGGGLTFSDSIVNNSGTVTLVNDTATPGDSKYYGTNSGGALGYYNLPTVTTGNLTDAGTDGITVTGGTGAVVGSGTSIAQHVADTSHNGYLASTDWNTFNGKQASGNYITALTGDATASGPGSAALTLATVNTNTGSFTNASITVNGKGLITAASSGTAPVTAVTASGPLSSSGGTTPNLTIALADNEIYVGNASNVPAAVAMSGDATIVASGALTLATVNTNTGSFTNASITVNGKGLITAASSGTPVTNNYYSGTMSSSASWSTGSSTFATPTNSGGNTLTQIYANGLTVTAASSSGAGITFTPTNSANVYYITAVTNCYNTNSSGQATLRLTDGTTAFAWAAAETTADTNQLPVTLAGIYAPGTTSAVTISFQLAAPAGTTAIQAVNSLVPSIMWNIFQIK